MLSRKLDSRLAERQATLVYGHEPRDGILRARLGIVSCLAGCLIGCQAVLPAHSLLPLNESELRGDLSRPAQSVGRVAAAGASACTIHVPQAQSERSFLYWRGDPAPVSEARIELEGCRGFSAESDSFWLVPGATNLGSTLEYKLDPAGLPSGAYSASIFVWSRALPEQRAAIHVKLDVLAEPAQAQSRNVLVIGLDGLDAEELRYARTPNIDGVMRAGLSTLQARTHLSGVTLSGPGWTSMLTGVEAVRHGVVQNGHYNWRSPKFPSFLWRARHDLGLKVAVIAEWADLHSIIEKDAYDSFVQGTAESTVELASDSISHGQHQVYFVHLLEADHAGHATGFSHLNPNYMAAVERLDDHVGKLLQAVAARPGIAQEQWLVVLTSDHGGVGRGHGCRNDNCRLIPFVVAGSGVPHAELASASHMDVYPTVLAFLGAAKPPYVLNGHARYQGAEAKPAALAAAALQASCVPPGCEAKPARARSAPGLNAPNSAIAE